MMFGFGAIEPANNQRHSSFASYGYGGAIRKLNETRGSSEASISSYIKSNYQDIPFSHPHFLTIHIEKLLEMDEIVSSTNGSQHYHLSNHNPNLKNGQEQQKKGSSRRKSSKKSKGLVVSAEDTHRAKKKKSPTDKDEQLVQCLNEENPIDVLIKDKEISPPCQEQQPKYCPRPRLYPPSVS
ncbi:hypothetical protein GIB67_019155 [Kingdonia uniflora]|uniref:H15 domain-containing protein n=1 Tax=Kingdonia uniflora TaxID=39325 RepID=A0A7J7MZT1_9MAGN|nr:hypothetical protein GIB67_019155 [Kingdonia uniflora]